MQIEGAANTALTAQVSVLKRANEQPQLAGELISKSLQNLESAQTAQTPVQPVDVSKVTGTGKIINTVA